MDPLELVETTESTETPEPAPELTLEERLGFAHQADLGYLKKIKNEIKIFHPHLDVDTPEYLAWRAAEDKKAQEDLISRFGTEPTIDELQYNLLVDRNKKRNWNPDPSNIDRGCIYIYSPNSKTENLTIQHRFTGATFTVALDEITYR